MAEVNCQEVETIQELKQKQLGICQDVKAISKQTIYLQSICSVRIKYLQYFSQSSVEYQC